MYIPGPLAQRFSGRRKWPKLQEAPARALEHQLVLLLFVIVLHVEWLFKAQSGPDKGNFWLILTHRSVMSSFGGRRNHLKFSKAPARAFAFCHSFIC